MAVNIELCYHCGPSNKNKGPRPVARKPYDCSLELAKEYWLFGVGVERLQFILDMCYGQFTAVNGETYFQYNTHNEYLNVLCGKGIIGLMAFLGLLEHLE